MKMEEEEVSTEMWEEVPKDRLTRGVAVMKVWDHTLSERMMWKMWIPMIGKLHAGEIKQLLT